MQNQTGLSLFRGCTVVGDTTFGGSSGRTLTEAFVSVIADAEGISPTELPSLYDSVDFEALSELLGTAGGAGDGEMVLSLRIQSWNVFVSNDGRIRICDATVHSDPEPIFGDAPDTDENTSAVS